MSGDMVLGQVDGEDVTLDDVIASIQRVAALPPMVPEEDRIPGDQWAEAVIRGEAPYGRCAYCRSAKGVAGCLNLCDMPAGAAREFTDGLMKVIHDARAATAWLEALGGCTCGPARYFGYQTERDSHDLRCPMNPHNRQQ